MGVSKKGKASFPADNVHLLPNGVRVVVVELPHLRSASISVMIHAGPRHETARTHGLSHFVEHMMFRGCAGLPSTRAMAVEAERFLGQLDGATYRDHVVFSTGFHPARMVDAVALMGRMMASPRFEGLAVEKRVLLEEITECFDEDGTEIEIDNISRALMFPKHPAGHSIDGTPTSVKRFTRKDVAAHHQQFYVGGNMVVSIAGPVDTVQVLKAAAKAFKAIPTGPAAKAQDGALPKPVGPLVKVVANPGSQAQLRLSWRGLGQHDPRHHALQLARRSLDDGFTTRFQSELVDRRGLAYEMWADLDLFEDGGTVEFGATVTHGKEALAVRALLAEAKRLCVTGPTSAELARAWDRFQWGLEQLHDHAPSVADWFGRSVLFNLEKRPEEVLASAAKVRPQGVRDVARLVFRPENLVVTLVGDVKRAEQSAIRKAVAKYRAV